MVVVQLPAPPSARNATVQPTGRVWLANDESVLAARPYESATGPVFLVTRINVVLLPGLVKFVTWAAASGPAPVPNAPATPAAALLVKSTLEAVTAVSVSTPVADLVGSKVDVAVTLTVNGPPEAVAGSTALTTTL